MPALLSRATPFIVLFAGAACSYGGPAASDIPEGTGIRLETVATGLSSPVFLTSPPDDARLFIVEQPGRVRVVDADGELRAEPYLDLTDRVRSGGERGLLGLAFHPAFASNGYVYVNFTDASGATRIERFTADPAANTADRATARSILSIPQPYGNHNGGLLAFGPDGMLYIGMGDGGSAGDPQGHGQDSGTLLGALLRIDVDGAEPYTIPSDNPFAAGSQGRPEIWATGLRNPWRFSFDPPSGLLYVADVGQNRWEEVNVVRADDAGLNYGWNVMEGAHCYGSGSCDSSGLVVPALEYGHSDGCSITGGYVYRGQRLPALDGHYFYGDYCRGWVRSFRFSDGAATEPRHWTLGSIGNVLSFGMDAAGELYVLSGSGRVYRIEPAH